VCPAYLYTQAKEILMVFPDLDTFLTGLNQRNPGEKEFHQASNRFFADVFGFVEDYPDFKEVSIPLRLTEPDSAISFRVCWEDDAHQVRVNRGYQVNFSNILGPCIGGVRFHPLVNLGIVKFLAFEQVLKNSLLPLGLGGAMGGSDFNPKDKSEGEIRRFCRSFMKSLIRNKGPGDVRLLADTGVGSRELGYLSGQSRELGSERVVLWTDSGRQGLECLTGAEAGGYGCVYFAENVLAESEESLEHKVCVLSGCGAFALHTAEKLLEKGARVVSFSDTSGSIYEKNGFDEEKLTFLKSLKFQRRGSLSEAAYVVKCEFMEATKPWGIPCDLGFACSTQNEVEDHDAALLVKNGCRWIFEGAHMPVTQVAAEILSQGQVTLVPGAAINAGGSALYGSELVAGHLANLPGSREDMESRLRKVMGYVHRQCLNYGKGGKSIDYRKGANLVAFERLAKALKDQGF